MGFSSKDIPGVVLMLGLGALIVNYHYPRELENKVVESVKNNDHYYTYAGEYSWEEAFVSEVIVCVKEPYQCFSSKDHDFLELKVGEKLKTVKYTPNLFGSYDEIEGYKREK